MVNRNPYDIQVLIATPGEVSDWTLADAESRPQGPARNLSLVDNLRGVPRPIPPLDTARSQTFRSGLVPGQAVILQPGEKLKFTYKKPPTWRWKALA